ncbi:MAG: phosphoribosylamine--glycine ligase [Acidobacteriota bacterium]
MRILVVGSGGREHALVWKLSRAEGLEELFAAPGNPGMAGVATCVPIPADGIVELAEFAASLRIDLTVVGPELPLVLGIGDEFARRGLALFGPSRVAAELEGSKVFTKEFCFRHGIPTAGARVVRSRLEAADAARDLGLPVVFKADGLAAGKGVLICRTPDDLEAALVRFYEDRAFGAAADRVVVEECLDGEEVSFMVVTDGVTTLPLATARDYKRLLEGDRGPNTGGMGSISPAPLAPELAGTILREVIHPTIAGMAEEGRPYRGVLYAGLMLTADGAKLLEFNCRLGDPETQAVIPRLEDDLYPLLKGCAEGSLAGLRATWKREAAACIVLAAEGYPGSPRKGDAVSGLADALVLPGVQVFHAATAVVDGRLVTAGGRVLSVVGRGPSVPDAVRASYEAVGRITFEGMQCRSDIGRGMQ